MSRPLDERVAVHVESRSAQLPESGGVPASDASVGRNGAATIGRLADELLPLLIARLGSSSLGELEVRHDGWRVRLRREANGDAAPRSRRASGSRSPERGAHRPAERAPDPGAPSRSAARGVGPGGGEPRTSDRTVVPSAAVGYYQPREGLAVGDNVRAGDVIGHVDVLGVAQEIVAPADGRISRLLAEPGEAVEYGQPLARLEPETRS